MIASYSDSTGSLYTAHQLFSITFYVPAISHVAMFLHCVIYIQNFYNKVNTSLRISYVMASTAQLCVRSSLIVALSRVKKELIFKYFIVKWHPLLYFTLHTGNQSHAMESSAPVCIVVHSFTNMNWHQRFYMKPFAHATYYNNSYHSQSFWPALGKSPTHVDK